MSKYISLHKNGLYTFSGQLGKTKLCVTEKKETSYYISQFVDYLEQKYPDLHNIPITSDDDMDYYVSVCDNCWNNEFVSLDIYEKYYLCGITTQSVINKLKQLESPILHCCSIALLTLIMNDVSIAPVSYDMTKTILNTKNNGQIENSKMTKMVIDEKFISLITKKLRLLLDDDVIKNCVFFCVYGDEFGKEYLDDIVSILYTNF